MKSFAQNAPTFYYVRPGMNLAELSWSPGTATEWTVKYATTTGDPTNEQYGTSITVNEANTTLTGLDPFTTYFVYVGARDGNGGLSWSNAYTFKTLATSFAITDDTPYFENFDNTQAFDWVFLSRQTNPLNSTNDTYASYNNHWVYGSGTYNSNYRSLYISYLNNTVYKQDAYYLGYDYAVKMVTLEGGKNYEVSYDWKNYPCLPNQNYQNPDYMDYFRVMLVPSSIHLDPYVNRKPSDLKCNSLPDGWIALDNGYFLVSSNLNWQNKRVTISIPEGQGGDYQVVFFWYSRSQDGHVTSNTPAAVDNLMINTFYGAAPTALTATHEARSAQLSWTENGSATAWEVMYFTGENNDPYTNDGTIVPANTNTIQLTGLTPETDYYAYVRACYSVDGEMKHTRWSSLCYFTTNISCYPVEDLEASNLTQTEATVSWEPGDEEEAWIVRFRNASGIPTTNGFDNGQLPQGWTGLRYDEDEETFVVDNNVWSFDGDNPINGTYSLTTSEEAYLMIPIQSATTQATFFMKGVDDGEVYTKVQAGVYTGDINVFDSDALDYYMENGSVPTTSTQYRVDLSEVPSNYYFYIYVAPTSGGGGPKNRSFKATIDDIVIYATDEWSEETVSITTRTFTNLEAATSYEVQVIAHCDEGDDSQWRSIVFTTPLCPPEDQCSISYTLGDSYGDGWNGNAIQVVDVQTGAVLDTWTIESGSSASGTLAVCNGRNILFQWVAGSFADECSFTIYDFGQSVIELLQDASDLNDGLVFAQHTVNCDVCVPPAGLEVTELTTTSATVSWELGDEETEWLVSYRNANAHGAVILDESNWTSPPEGWAAFGPNAQFDGLEPITTDWIVDDGALVSHQMSFLFIPVTFGGQAVITVQGNENEAIVAGLYSGSLEEIELANLDPSAQQIDLLGTTQSISIDLDGNEGTGYLFLFHSVGEDPENLYLKQLVVYGSDEWTESILVVDTPSYTIENLETGSTYQVQVQNICGQDDYSNPVQVSFLTPFCNPEYQCEISYTLGDSYGDGWTGNAIQVVDDNTDVVVATITMEDQGVESTYVEVSGILALCEGRTYHFVWVNGGANSYPDECSFTINGTDGTEIVAYATGEAEDLETGDIISTTVGCSEPQQLTFEKSITGYGTGNDNWYLIASPMAGNVAPTAVSNMIVENPDEDNSYDLFYFDQNAELEWVNYKQHSSDFTLEPGKGYLYANKNTVTLTFTGTPYSGNGVFPLAYVAGAEFAGWNLIGNPFGVAATLDMPYYRMNDNQTTLGAKIEGGQIEAMEGVFVYAYDTEHEQAIETATFTRAGRSNNASQGFVNLNVEQNASVVDNVIVRFDEGRSLPKLQLFKGSARLFIPQNGKDYAIVSSATHGEMPLNFKTEENGTYTLSIETENVEMDYLHLIDNMTGADVDLLATPSYTFEAKTTDYKSRFRLVFSINQGDVASSFAFFNGNEWVVDNEGRATLQLIDVMGRVLSSETIQGNATINISQPTGVYMLRLVNSNEVKTQKIVVR